MPRAADAEQDSGAGVAAEAGVVACACVGWLEVLAHDVRGVGGGRGGGAAGALEGGEGLESIDKF